MTISKLTFHEATHTYLHDGIVVPSVTTILKPLSDFDRIPKMVLEGARKRGVMIHRAVDLYNRNDLDEDMLDEGLKPYLDQYKRFLANTGFEVTSSEQRVFNEEMYYAGTCDLTGNWKGTTWVGDVKSGLVPKSVGPQLAAYQHALDDRPRRRFWVQLKPDKYAFGECDGMGDWAVFQSCLNIWKFLHPARREQAEATHDRYS